MTFPAPTALSRRSVLMSLAAAPLALHTKARAQDAHVVKICQSTALSGPLGDLGQAMNLGAQACFAAVNAQGGVHGRKIELEALDDGYDVKRAVANAEKFVSDRNTFALFNCMGTPMVAAMLPHVLETGVPFFAPFTGALLARPRNWRRPTPKRCWSGWPASPRWTSSRRCARTGAACPFTRCR